MRLEIEPPGFGVNKLRDVVLQFVESSFDRDQPIIAPPEALVDVFRRVSDISGVGRAATVSSTSSARRDHETRQAQTLVHLQQEQPSAVSERPVSMEQMRVERETAGLKAASCSSGHSITSLPSFRQSQPPMEEEKVADLYFKRFDLIAALHWFRKAEKRLGQRNIHPRYYHVSISISRTLIWLGNFGKACQKLDEILRSTDGSLPLSFESALAQCRSLCCASSADCRKVAESLEGINKRYEDDALSLSQLESTSILLNSDCLASLRLFLGESKTAEMISLGTISAWQKLQDQQLKILDSVDSQKCSIQCTEQRCSSANQDCQASQSQNNRSSEGNLSSPELATIELAINRDRNESAQLERQIKYTTKNLLDSQFRLVKIYTDCGRIKEALTLNEELIHQMRKSWGPDHVVPLRALNFHSKLLLLQDDLNNAETTCKGSIRRIADHLGSEHYITLECIGTLANIYLAQGRWTEAHEIAESLVLRNRTAVGERHPQTILSEACLAYVLDLLGRTIAAEKLQRIVHEKCVEVFGQCHSETVVSSSRLAQVCYNAGKRSEAVEHVREVHQFLKISKKQELRSFSIATAYETIGSLSRKLASDYRANLDPRADHVSTVESKNGYAELFEISGNLLRRALNFYRGALQDKDHVRILSGRFERCLLERDREEKVNDKLLVDLHDILRTRCCKASHSHPEIATMQHELSLSYASIGKWRDALGLGSAALDARLLTFGKSHPEVLKSRLQLAPILWCADKTKEAVEQLKHIHDAVCDNGSNYPNFDLLSVKGKLANALVRIGEYEEAVVLQEELVAESKDRSNYLATRSDLALIYERLKRFEDAEKEYNHVEEELRNRSSVTPRKTDAFVMIVKSNKVSLHMEKGEYAKAEKLQRELKKTLKGDPSYGEINRDTITARCNLAVILKKQGKDGDAEKQLRKAWRNMVTVAGKDDPESLAMDAQLQEWTKSSSEKRI